MTFFEIFKKVYLKQNNVEFSDDSLDLFETLFHYFTGNEEKLRESNLLKRNTGIDKGLIIIGTCGVGKTSIIEALKYCFDNIDGFKSFKYITASEIVRKYDYLNPDSVFEEFGNAPLFIDEILKEPSLKSLEVVGKLLEYRDGLKLKTYLCTNIVNLENPERDFFNQIKERYGIHIQSRLLTYNLVTVIKKDKRWQN